MRLFEKTTFAFEKGPNDSNQQRLLSDQCAPSLEIGVEFHVDTHGGVDIKRGLASHFATPDRVLTRSDSDHP